MRYFAIIDDHQQGPFTLEELAEAGVSPGTYVWCKDMEDWRQAREVGDICRHFRNRLYDKMHPALTAEQNEPKNVDNTGNNLPEIPLRFRRQLEKANPEDVDFTNFGERIDYSQAPSTWFPFPILLSLITFFPLGILAVSQAHKAKKAWKAGKAIEAYEFARRGKMAAGMSFSFGFILVAFLLAAII